MTDLEECTKHCGDDAAMQLENLIPDYMHSAIVRYVLHGIEAGGFLDAVICNNLFKAVGKADDINRNCLHEYCAFFYNDAPAACYGSKEKRDAWIKHGGLIGLRKADEGTA